MKRGSVRYGSLATLALLLQPILLRAGRSLFGVETSVQLPADRSSIGTDRSLYKPEEDAVPETVALAQKRKVPW